MPALARGVIPGQPPAKGIKFPQGLDHPASRETFGPKLQSTFGALGRKGVGAPQRVEPQQQKYGVKTFGEVQGQKRSGHPFEIPVKTGAGYELKQEHPNIGIASPTLPGLGTVATATAAGKAAQAISPATGKSFLGNAYTSAINTIAGAVPATYGMGKAGLEAVEGHPKALGGIGKELLHTVEHPWTSFKQNPFGTALMAAAPFAALGRGGGALGRAAGVKAASTARAPLYVYGRSTGASTDQLASGLHDVSIPRSYSPNVISKGAQVACYKLSIMVVGS